jgi:hypothetical protein
VTTVQTEPAAVSPAPAEPEFADGALVVVLPFNERPGEPPSLGIITEPIWSDQSAAWQYWITYCQFPERGHPTGGSSGYWTADRFRLPETVEEHILALQYRSAARVLALQAELETAQAEAAAATSTLALFRRGGVA